ncbi:MAG: helix-turn-helix domain-containing protein [Microbacterium sp.]
MVDPTRGVLYPARLPSFTRVAPPASVAALISWLWIPEWDLAPGRSSRQEIVGYPASNLVVESQGDVVVAGVAGPSTRRSHRDLRGRGWAVGALLRPAAVPAVVGVPSCVVDRYEIRELPELAAAVESAMRAEDAAARHAAAVGAFAGWLAARVPPPDEKALLANGMADLLMQDAGILRVEQAAARLSVSVRTLQRLAHRYVGVSASAMIRRRRLQEAAQRVREHPGADLAELAAQLGYADHAHLTNDFRAVLGFTPSRYRSTQPGRLTAAARQTTLDG